MISLACAAALLTLQTSPKPNTQVAEPARPVPSFPIPTNHVEISGKSFVYRNDHELGAYLPAPAEGDVWKAIEKVSKNPTTTAKKKLKVKIFLLSENLTIGRIQGKYVQDRDTLVGAEREAFQNVLIQYTTLLRASGFEPEVSFTDDDDLTVINDFSQAPGLISSIVAPNINDQQFLGDDPTYRGPFDVILALTSAPLPEIWNGPLDQSLISIIPMSRLSPQFLDVDLAAYLYNSTSWQLRTAPETNRLIVRTPVAPTEVIPSIDPTLVAPTDPMERTPTPRITPLAPESPLHAKPIDTTIVLLPDAQIAVTGIGTEVLKAATASPQPPKLNEATRGLDLQGRIWTIYKTDNAKSLLDLLKFTPPVTVQGEKAVPTEGPLPLEYKLYGHFRETQPLTSLNPIPNTFTHYGFQNKGGIELISRKQIPVIDTSTPKTLNYTIQSDTQEVLAFMFFGKTGTLLKAVQISGLKQEQPWILQRQNFTGKGPQSGSIPLDSIKEPIYKIVLGVPPQVIPSSRVSSEAKIIEISSISIANGVSATPPTDEAPALENFDNNAPNAELEKIATGNDSLLAFAALGILSDQPVASQAPFFGVVSRDASSSMAWLACKALNQLSNPEAQAEIDQTLKLGPFDFNRRCAALAAKAVEGKTYLDVGNFLLSGRSWQTRAQGARLISLTKSEAAQTFLVSSLYDPSPNVRGTISGLLDPDFSLSGRRLLFLAVNDSCEDIRAICYTRLLNAKDETLVTEALAGIKDESRLVRLAILSRLMAKPDEKYRSTYRIAVLDKDPVVQSLVLKAFSQLPDPVELGEISNVIGNKSNLVQIALLQLADIKKVKLPAEELARLAASEDKIVSDLAKKLQGGNG
ncbi:MAG: hypothetical protein ACKVQS_13125 [Fimbriimonadaceae bacterium]